ncbi:YjbE family putative metal transport protein [Acetobacter indonesiensis]|uniref:Membrane protein n=1 Tax=Acetobacter indonesiensis TaxID=104101 RepID=A0A252AVF3_9PROT|nr:YjbE family putative metal transport protein [Acetobacter indonesiensis]MCG0995751.1 YjbE family putative metal transport protein [Acetobacter indonesiensis]MCP1230801.1 YjbE family putative metal transport protein [Acetobacter indonesiensis]OUI94249.1 membrane protein [Acetobacter indonesiensis]OUI95759.1 membrane protein [Acetobacter indonesiensis]GAN63902.1 integral membrane protein TerC [Acetobacter indonesiensis]
MHGLLDAISLKAVIAFLQVVLIDVTLAGDNAVVIGLVVRSLAPADRKKAIFTGIAAAAIIRILMALVAVKLLAIVGLTLAGGLLLLWVCWRMYREMRSEQPVDENGAPAPGSFGKAVFRILIADLSMSLDNVLAVAGAASEHPGILVMGLVLSVLLMGVAATYIARLLDRYKWISWVGLLIVLGVAIELIIKGGGEIWGHIPH